MLLQQRGMKFFPFVGQGLNDVGMVVSRIVDAVAGEKIQNATTVVRE